MFQGVRAIRKKLRIPLATLAGGAIIHHMNPEQANRLTRILVNTTGIIVVGVGCLIIFQAITQG